MGNRYEYLLVGPWWVVCELPADRAYTRDHLARILAEIDRTVRAVGPSAAELAMWPPGWRVSVTSAVIAGATNAL